MLAGVAHNTSYVGLSEHLAPVGMHPPTGILTSTKRHHDKWSELAYQASITGFWSRVVPDADTGCWVWNGALNAAGYGRTGTPYWHEVYAHRLAWEMLHGRPAPRSSGLELDHACLNRACVNVVDHIRQVPIAANREGRRQRMSRMGVAT